MLSAMALPWRILGFLLGLVVLVIAWPYASSILTANGVPAESLKHDALSLISTLWHILLKGLGMAQDNLARYAR